MNLLLNRKICRNRKCIAIITIILVIFCTCLSLGQSYETANAESEPNIRLRESFLRHLVWEIPKNETTGCINTIQGQSLICDDRGVVCARETIQADGCCPEIDIIPCQAFNECDQSASCCSIYEHCVSCCVQPNNKDTLTKFVLSTIVSLERLFGSIENQFQLCLTKCRTSSLSVQHENTYRDPKFKYCYGSDPPRLRFA